MLNSKKSGQIQLTQSTPITEVDVVKILNLRESKNFMKSRLEQIEDELSVLETRMVELIELNMPIVSRHIVNVKVSERRYPSWKDAFINYCGEQESKKIVASTTPTISKSIVITIK